MPTQIGLAFRVPWSALDIAVIACRALHVAATACDREQSPRGLDALEELDLHPILARAFRDEGLGVHREQPYPGTVGHPNRRERQRCDLVITPMLDRPLIDPVAARLEAHAARDTLFADHLKVAHEGVPSDDALWIEVKSVGQFCFTDGVPGPNPSYVADMTAWITDLAKLTRDPVILHAAALTVAFAQDERTLRHDLGVALDRALKKDLPLAAPAIECAPIADRIGNAVVGVCVVPLSKATVLGA